MAEGKNFSKEVSGKTVVSKSGKRFGHAGDLVFEVRTGEIIYVVLKNPTPFASSLELEHDKEGNFLIPFNSVIAVGDFVVVSEQDIV